MSTEWVVELVFAHDHTAEELMRLEDAFADTHLDVSVSAQPQLHQWTLTTSTMATNGLDALHEVMRYVEKVDVQEHPIAMNATEIDEYERRAQEPTLPVLVGASEVAELLDVSRQRVHQLRSHSAFPAPLVEVAMGPLWDERAVEKFSREWTRKPGRPPALDDSYGVGPVPLYPGAADEE